jgi:hypothetical protein
VVALPAKPPSTRKARNKSEKVRSYSSTEHHQYFSQLYFPRRKV